MPTPTTSVGMERKLTAILSADVHGYSRLMGENEEATIRTLTAYRQLMTTSIHQHRGRVVDSPGDNLLAEFASVVDALRCAVEIQHELKAKNAALPDHRKMEFRIGINLGDVVVEGERLYGDGVNIAARLESLAEPGGICLSGTVYDHIENKLALQYEYLGEQTVKNIIKPVRVYRVVLDEAAWAMVEQAREHHTPQRPARRRGRPWGLVSAVIVILAVGGVTIMRYWAPPFLHRSSRVTHEEPALPLPDKPSIAILPFTNMSGDPTQEYFSDGITEDLITDLSKLSGLFVIARNSTFIYKGKAVKVAEIGHELGVRYVLEGSVRRAGDQVRVTAQLVDATTGHHLWAERYDRELKDIFALQDEIRQKIVMTLQLQLTLWEQRILVRKHTDNLEAYDYYLRGLEYFFRFTQEANEQARQMLERAIELDPEYAEAYAWLGWAYYVEWFSQWSQEPQIILRKRPSREQAFALARQAITLNDSLPEAHHLAGYGYMFNKQHERAIAAMERAVALGPNDADAYASLAVVLMLAERPEEAIELVEKAMRLNPYHPPYYLSWLGQAYRLTGQYEEAISPLEKAITLNPNFLFDHINLAAIYSELGREEEARTEAAEVLRISPNLSLEGLRQSLPYKDPADLERFLSALRKAGLK